MPRSFTLLKIVANSSGSALAAFTNVQFTSTLVSSNT